MTCADFAVIQLPKDTETIIGIQKTSPNRAMKQRETYTKVGTTNK